MMRLSGFFIKLKINKELRSFVIRKYINVGFVSRSKKPIDFKVWENRKRISI